MVQPGHYVKPLDLLHSRVHVLSVPFATINSLVFRYLEAIGRIGVDSDKLPGLVLAVDPDLVDSAKCSLTQKFIYGFQLIVWRIF